MASKEEHEREVDKLFELENQLIELISSTDNSELMDKFGEWQSQRAKCNDLYVNWIESLNEKAS